jgi:hypothetical protein
MVTRVVHVRSRLWQETPPEQRVWVGRKWAELRIARVLDELAGEGAND